MARLAKHIQNTAAIAVMAVLTPLTALASTGDPVITFDTGAIPGSEVNALAPYKFDYDDFLVSDDGATVVTQIDSDKSGTLTPGDGFSEFTVVSASAFRKDGTNVPAGVSGLNFDYSLITTITLGGFVVPVTPAIVDVFFTTGTGTMVYDEDSPGFLNPLGGGSLSVAVASLGDPVAGSCRINLDNLAAGGPAGACVVTFDFTSLLAGVFVSATAGDLLPLTDDLLRVDINIDEVVGLAELLAGGFGPGCAGAAVACTKDIGITHNGSARHVVSAPGTLALLGLGLLVLARRFGARKAI